MDPSRRLLSSECTSDSFLAQPTKRLPDEIWVKIFSNLELSDLAAAGSVSRHFYSIARDNAVWRIVADRIDYLLPVSDILSVRDRVQGYIFLLRHVAKFRPHYPGAAVSTPYPTCYCFLPPDIKAILEQEPSIKNTRRLKQWVEIGDTLSVQNRLACRIRGTYRSTWVMTEAEMVAKYNDFNTWLERKKVRLANVKDLDLSDCMLTLLPEVIFTFSQLESLRLSGNRLSELTQSIGTLRHLSIVGSDLSMLPDAIGKLSKLKFLDLSHNKLRELPQAIDKLARLKYLILTSNQLHALPDTIGNITTLTELDASRNQLRILPHTISNLTALSRLDVSNNQLSMLPEAIGNLTALRTLHAENNQLSTLSNKGNSLSVWSGCRLLAKDIRNILKAVSELIVNVWNNFYAQAFVSSQ